MLAIVLLAPSLLGCGCRGKTGVVRFNFILNEDETEYSVQSQASFANGVAEIPAVHKGKPVTAISGAGFKDAIAFIALTVPESIMKISNEAFKNCEALTLIFKGTEPAEIGDNSFGTNTSGLTDRMVKAIIVPDAALETYKTEWPKYAARIYSATADATDGKFIVRDGLLISYYGKDAKVEIPAGATEIAANAFWNNELLHEVDIHAGVEILGLADGQNHGFGGCRNISKITINAANPYYTVIDNVIYSKETTEPVRILFVSRGLTGKIAIPEGVTEIPEGDMPKNGIEKGFKNCENITEIILPSTLTKIGSFAFEGCKKIKAITIPASVTAIGQDAFKGCRKLKIKASIPESEKPPAWAEGWDGNRPVEWLN